METVGMAGNGDWITFVAQNMIPFAISILHLYLLFLLGRGLYHKKTWAFWTAGILLVLIIILAGAAFWLFNALSNTNWSL